MLHQTARTVHFVPLATSAPPQCEIDSGGNSGDYEALVLGSKSFVSDYMLAICFEWAETASWFGVKGVPAG